MLCLTPSHRQTTALIHAPKSYSYFCLPPKSFSHAPLELLSACQTAYEETLQHKLGLQKRLQSLRAEEVLQETPGKQRGGTAGASELVEKLLHRQEHLEVSVGTRVWVVLLLPWKFLSKEVI